MKHVGDLISQKDLRTFKPETERPRGSNRPMLVWVSLADLFGRAFHREHGENPGTLWQEAIWKLTDKEISRGLTNLAEDGLEFPPNYSQFVAACRKITAEAISPPYWNAPRIEDQRKSDRMPYREWLQREGKDHPLVK